MERRLLRLLSGLTPFRKYSVDWKTLRKLDSHGMMSAIYTCNSNNGPLIIHVVQPCKEQKLQKTHLKVLAASRMTPLPKAEVYFVSDKHDYFIVCQKKISGSVAGMVVTRRGKLTNIIKGDDSETMDKVFKLLAQLHSYPVRGFGFLRKDGTARFKTWKAFLSHTVNRSIHTIDRQMANKKNYLLQKKIVMNAMRITLRNQLISKIKKSYFVHGDMINLANVIRQPDGKLIIVDYEWCLGGDPAYEFARSYNDDISLYYKYVNVNRIEFEQRRTLYQPIVLLWVCNVLGVKTPEGMARWNNLVNMCKKFASR